MNEIIDVKKIREDFKIFTNRKDLVYLDTAATSLTPVTVMDKVEDYYSNYRANIHRGLYDISEEATSRYEHVRESVAQFICADKSEIIFTAGSTHSSNMLVYILEQELVLEEDDEIVVSIMEHHASLVPLQELAKRKKLKIKFIPLLDDVTLNIEKARELITERTKIVSVVLASNVTGTINDVDTITSLAHKVGAFMISDVTAAVGHMDVQVRDVDALYFSGHKMCGPTGVGVLYLKDKYISKFSPAFYGGGIVKKVEMDTTSFIDGVQKFESGTPNIAGVIGLEEAVAYISKITTVSTSS